MQGQSFFLGLTNITLIHRLNYVSFKFPHVKKKKQYARKLWYFFPNVKNKLLRQGPPIYLLYVLKENPLTEHNNFIRLDIVPG